jgi:hypothetical protein
MIAEKISRQAARLNAALAGKAAPDVELEAAVAFQRTTRRVAAAIAREIGCPEKTVQDWGNINSGDRGPHLALLFVLQLARAMRPAGERAEIFSALDFVERHLGRVAFDLPLAQPVTSADRAKHLAFTLIQLGEYFELAANDELSPEQLTRPHQEKQDVLQAIEALFPSRPAPTPPAVDASGNVATFQRGRS